MWKTPLFKEFLIASLVLGVLHNFAAYYDWYWIMREFDSLMHFLGGLWVGFSVLWFYFYSGVFSPERRGLKDLLWVSFSGLICFGVVWEIYELVVGATFVSDLEYVSDTTLDFIMDVLGTLAASLYTRWRT